MKRKTCQLHFRCTPADKLAITSFAKKANMSISDYLLKVGLQKKIITKQSELLTILNNITTSDNKLDNNINQIAHKLNSNPNISENDILEIINYLKLVTEKRDRLFHKITKIFHLLS